MTSLDIETTANYLLSKDFRVVKNCKKVGAITQSLKVRFMSSPTATGRQERGPAKILNQIQSFRSFQTKPIATKPFCLANKTLPFRPGKDCTSKSISNVPCGCFGLD